MANGCHAYALARNGLPVPDGFVLLQQVRKLGSMEEVLGMLPGASQMKGKLDIDERWSSHAEAIICSMTPKERHRFKLVDASRKRRIARGAGRPLSEVNRLLKSFKQAKKLHQKMLAAGRSGRRMPGLPSLG